MNKKTRIAIVISLIYESGVYIFLEDAGRSDDFIPWVTFSLPVLIYWSVRFIKAGK